MKIIKLLFRFISLIVFIAIVGGIYATFIERKLLTVNKDKIIIDSNWSSNIKVVQFTDTQLGEFYTINDLEKAVEKINEQKPDIVVFTGDLIDNAAKYEDINKIAPVLSKIESKYGKFAVWGNHDYGGGASRYYEDIMEESNFTLLTNGSKSIKIGNKKINIFGGDDGLMGYHDVERTMEGINKNDTNLLLIHEPDLIDQYKDYPIDLALSGHSHGGQVYIPFYGPIVKTVLAKKYTKGLYNIDNERETKLYVSSGLGNTKVPFRFLNIPEIKVFNLQVN